MSKNYRGKKIAPRGSSKFYETEEDRAPPPPGNYDEALKKERDRDQALFDRFRASAPIGSRFVGPIALENGLIISEDYFR